MMQLKVHAAKWWEKEEDSKTRCLLCPRRCLIPDGGAGVCAVRLNRGGELVSQAYGYPVALQIDPIEKKPLRHFLPRTGTFSIGTLGCNLKCVFCQNHHLSRAAYQERLTYRYFESCQIAELAKRHGCASLSFTYNEPTVFGEYVIDAANAAHEIGLKTVLVSNAYINREAAKEIYPLMDAANIDVKGFSEEYYREMCGGSLKPVTDAVEFYKNEIGGHVELTYLVIPGKNDADQMIDDYLDWVETKLGIDTPLHFTAYHPDYKYSASPRTPLELLYKIQNHALVDRKFPNVYLGNIC